MTTIPSLCAFGERLLEFLRSAPPGPSDNWFNSMALELFQLQFDRVPAYRRLCEARRLTPDRIRTWQQIPPLPTSAFKEFDVTSLATGERQRVFFSSGTTAQRPSRHFHSAESLRIYEASLLAWFGRHLLPETAQPELLRGTELCPEPNGLALIALTPRGDQATHSSLVHMFETVAQGFPFASATFCGWMGAGGAWEIDLERASDALERCVTEERPALLLGTAFTFVHLLDGLVQSGRCFSLPPGSRALETGGYKGRSRALGKSELLALIEDRLGVPAGSVISEYGMSELSSQAYDRAVRLPGTAPAAGVFHFPPWARATVHSPETGLEVAEGETGLIRVFDLANVFSVAAIQTEDLAKRRGRGFELAGRQVQAEPRGCSLMSV